MVVTDFCPACVSCFGESPRKEELCKWLRVLSLSTITSHCRLIVHSLPLVLWLCCPPSAWQMSLLALPQLVLLLLLYRAWVPAAALSWCASWPWLPCAAPRSAWSRCAAFSVPRVPAPVVLRLRNGAANSCSCRRNYNCWLFSYCMCQTVYLYVCVCVN